MNNPFLLLFWIVAGATLAIAQAGEKGFFQNDTGTIAFEAVTNVPGIEVKGKSNALSARAEVFQNGADLVVRRVEASLQVSTLTTGMKVRDEHMRKYIFTTPDGQLPALSFTAGQAGCGNSGAREYSCEIPGYLTIRGVSRPLTIRLRVKQETASLGVFHAAGDGTVKLSDYGIEAPSQFGVKPSNDVRIHIEFSCRKKAEIAADASAGAGDYR